MGKAKKVEPAAAAEAEYMSAEQLQHFQKLLEDWRAEMLEESRRTREHMSAGGQNTTADLNDRATLEEEFSLELRARDRERKLLNKIELALQRIQRDEFGWCERCGNEIGLKRLEARPTAELCIDCKEIAERIERNYMR